MPVEIIKKFVDEFTSSDQNLLNQRFIVLCLIGFAGFFRIEELLGVRIKDVTIFPDHIEIFLPKSKSIRVFLDDLFGHFFIFLNM